MVVQAFEYAVENGIAVPKPFVEAALELIMRPSNLNADDVNDVNAVNADDVESITDSIRQLRARHLI
ncbi:hypothetical protein [Rhodococcus marinonascens]|uniref:hypothetical protein n=1 Tax=Rhodococcus marinonascens TaxID=38311 RepID=UPI0009345919|nr:hypothetical protein [Rhodococcus marinonascens]